MIRKLTSATDGRYRLLAVVLGLSVALGACVPASIPSPTPIPTAAVVPKAPAVPTATPAPSKPTPAPPTAAPKPVSLKLGSSGVVNYAGAYIAAEMGFFKAQGIDLEVVTVPSGAQAVAPLGAGQVDLLGTALSQALLSAVDRGIEMKMVADMGQNIPNWTPSWLVLRKDLADSGEVKTPADLKGKKLAIPSQGSYGQLLFEMALAEGSLKTTDVEFVILGFPDLAPAFANKAVVAGFAVEPFVARGVQEGVSVKWIPDHKYYGGRAQNATVIFGPRLAKDKDLGKRFMVAYLKGVGVYLDAFGEKKLRRDEVVNILIKYSTVKDPALYNVMEMPYIEPNGIPDKKSMEIQYKWYVSSGSYKGTTTLDDFTDLSFVQQAAQELGKR